MCHLNWLAKSALKSNQVNSHIWVKWVTFWVTHVTESDHKKLDNPVHTFKNGDYTFRAGFRVFIKTSDYHSIVNVIQYCLFCERIASYLLLIS